MGYFPKNDRIGNNIEIITRDTLEKAIPRALDNYFSRNDKLYNHSKEDLIKDIPKLVDVLDFFGSDDEIIDNMLRPDNRDSFNILEELGLLGTRRDLTTLPVSGKLWRINSWYLKKDKIIRLCEYEEVKQPKVNDTKPEETFYQEFWAQKKVEV